MAFPLLIFTDLDGTLLDHHTYSFKEAEEALMRLHQLAIPIILTSSKTRAEILSLQDRLGLCEAFITENGGGIFLPPGHPLKNKKKLQQLDGLEGIQFGKPYAYIRSMFEKVRAEYNLKGFGDMTVAEISRLTGLGLNEAGLARQRDFSEPFLFLAEPRPQELKEEMADHGLTVTRGGRFYHLMSAGQDKGIAVTETTRLFQADSHDRITTVALGDAENDIVMLRVVDIPVLIPKPDGTYENVKLDGLRKAPYSGSRGWGAAIIKILNDFQLVGSKNETHGLLKGEEYSKT